MEFERVIEIYDKNRHLLSFWQNFEGCKWEWNGEYWERIHPEGYRMRVKDDVQGLYLVNKNGKENIAINIDMWRAR